MRRLTILPAWAILTFISLLAGLVAAFMTGNPAEGVLLAMAAAAPVARRPTVNWGRKREPMKTFTNVGASQTAYTKIPRYPRTILGFQLERGGTTFAFDDLSRIELFLGEKSIWGPISGDELAAINRYINEPGEGRALDLDAYFTDLDFTFANVKEIGGEQIGGLDLTMLPEGELRLECDLDSTVSAPTLRGDVVWAPPQGGGDLGGLMRKLVRRTYPQFPAGDAYPDVNLRGAIVARHYIFGAVATAATSTAFTAANASRANTGNGAMGAITVSARTPCGRYTLVIVEPGSNVGSFVVFDPQGRPVGNGVVAAAYSDGRLAFTLADGGTDFVAGDGFYIDVLPFNVNQNINSVEVKKNEDVWWSYSDKAARFLQAKKGRQPLSQLYVVDFLADNHADSVIDTANAQALDYKLNVTAAETPKIISEVLAAPTLF